MKSFRHKSTTLVRLFGGVSATAVFLVVAVFVVVSRVGATSTIDSQGDRLVTIHDRSSQTVISTGAKTIGEALAQAGVVIDKADAVEPAVTEKLIATEYDVNIYRARPVIVVDGTTKQKVITPYQSGIQIARSAGITLYDEDNTTLTRSDDIVSEGAGLQLIIDRAVPFTFILYGKTTEARTQGATVGEMLKEKNITLGKDDKVSVDTSTKLTNGLVVKVWREGKQTITVDEPINFTSTDVQDGDQYVGYRATKTPGQAGSRSVTYEVLIQDGQEVGRTEIASITTKEPTTQIDIVGAKYRGAYTTPTENEVISWNFFIANGFSREQTAGIMGNLMQEHRFNTTGDGLAQWTVDRKAALLARPDPYNIYTQLDFIMYEFKNGYGLAYRSILASNTVEGSVIAFQNYYEACGDCRESQRIQYAFNTLASH